MDFDQQHQTIKQTLPDSGFEDVAPLTVILPVFNEAFSVAKSVMSVVTKARKNNWQVIAVDDGSTDGSSALLDEIARDNGEILQVIHHPVNRGYGAALKSGIRHTRTQLVATMDSDGQHTTDMLTRLLQEFDTHDMIVGQRQGLIHSKFWRMPGKWFLGVLASYLSQQPIPDLNSGLRVFRTSIIRQYLHLFPNGFSFSTTSTLILINRGYNVEYVPITVHVRTGKSTVSLRTGFDTIVLILRLIMLLAPLRIFLPVSLLSMTAGMLWAIPYLLDRQGLTVAALLLILNGVLILLVGLLADQVAELRKERFEDWPST